MRYETTSNGIKSYGWQRHDGRSFGIQNVKDSEIGVEINTSFVKTWPSYDTADSEAPKGGGDWALKFKVAPLKGSKVRGGVPKTLSVVLHVCTLGKNAFLSEPKTDLGTGNSPLATFTGTNAATGRFAISVFGRGEGNERASVSYFGGKHKREQMEQADDLLKNIYRYAMKNDPMAQTLRLPDEMHDVERANAVYIQVVIPVGGEVDVVFNSFQAHSVDEKMENGASQLLDHAQELAGAKLTNVVAARLHAFDAKFENMFKLSTKACKASSSKSVACKNEKFTEAATEVGKVALSQIMGGITYLDGTWFKAVAPHYNTSSEQAAVVSFSATPCRDGFARGFLWDEGFHQLLVSRWDPEISRDILLHWFALMQHDGWIPREQFIGGETRRRIESRWWVQNPTHANPPTLLLALEVLIDSGNAPESFLKCMAPKVKVWLDWFKRTQRAPALYSFKWSGRQRTDGIWHTLSSGLDDYPRANWTSDVADRHVDLYSWIVMMHRVLMKMNQKLELDHTGLASTVDTLKKHVEAIHWNNDTMSFGDRGYMEYGPRSKKTHRVDFVRHHGYVSLFPFLLDVLPEDFGSLKMQAIIDVLKSEKYLMSKAGLRSLSPTAPGGGRDVVYGSQEDYWRGKVWININYLALAALHKHKSSPATYDTLRANIVDTITASYVKKGFLFEQYDDKTREGLKHKPFAGWTALVLLIMAEAY